MAKFYFTYGDNPAFPYQDGWTEVIAEEAEFVESLNQSAPAPAPAAPEPPKTDTSKILERIQEQKTFEEELQKLDDLDLPFQF